MARPSDARVALLTAIGELHDDWVQDHLDGAFTPRGEKSDYNLHYVDVDAEPAALDEFLGAVDGEVEVSRARDGHELHDYWTRGAGLARWASSPRPFTTLLNFLRRHMPEIKARKTTAEWFEEVMGYLPKGFEKRKPQPEATPVVDPVTLREQRERERRQQRKKRAARRSIEESLRARNSLKAYWLHGEGAARWSTWTELYNHLKEHVTPERAKRIAAQWFHARYGYWPGHQKGANPHGPG